VEDCFVADGFPARIEVRDGVAIERDTLTVAGRLKYDYEVAAPATTFKFRILVENASDEEMGLLFLALRQLEKGALRLGGNTSRGLGVVGLTYSSIQDASFSDPETLLQYLVARESGVPEPSASEEPAPRPGMVEDIEGFVEERIERLISKLREGGRPRYRLKALRTWIKSLISKLR
jgi:CRISPR/Cas system CSM-associated protein Csm3 (group 7 of RAMP superfamily)